MPNTVRNRPVNGSVLGGWVCAQVSQNPREKTSEQAPMADGVHGGNDRVGVLVEDQHSQWGRVAADFAGRVEDDERARSAGRACGLFIPPGGSQRYRPGRIRI